MKIFLYLMVLLLFRGSGATTFLSGQDIDPSRTPKTKARSLRIAIVQMKSLDHDIDGNLRRATSYADQAVAQGVQFVLFPELITKGSYLSFDTGTRPGLRRVVPQ
jgi:hypothetical protein